MGTSHAVCLLLVISWAILEHVAYQDIASYPAPTTWAKQVRFIYFVLYNNLFV